MGSENITWLDWVSFFATAITFAVAYRLDLRHAKHLEEINRKEHEIEGKVNETSKKQDQKEK